MRLSENVAGCEEGSDSMRNQSSRWVAKSKWSLTFQKALLVAVWIGWGDYTYGQTNVPPASSGAMAIANGQYHCLALLSNSVVVGWGWNASGQAQPPPGLTNVIAIAAGSRHSLALRADGTVVAWGD